MKAERGGPARTLYRLVVMVGSLGVGSMGAYEYGPPPEELARWINSALGSIDVPNAADGEEFEAIEPIEFAQPASGLASWSDDSAATVLAGSAPADAPPASDEDALVTELERAGASDAKIEPWGYGADRLYRASATAPSDRGAGPRRLDAFGETPTEASHSLVAQLRSQRR